MLCASVDGNEEDLYSDDHPVWSTIIPEPEPFMEQFRNGDLSVLKFQKLANVRIMMFTTTVEQCRISDKARDLLYMTVLRSVLMPLVEEPTSDVYEGWGAWGTEAAQAGRTTRRW